MQAAVAAGNVLVVCYFDGEVGQGKVKWEEVAAQSRLRDAVLAKKEAAEKAASGTLPLPRLQQQAAFVARRASDSDRASDGGRAAVSGGSGRFAEGGGGVAG